MPWHTKLAVFSNSTAKLLYCVYKIGEKKYVVISTRVLYRGGSANIYGEFNANSKAGKG